MNNKLFKIFASSFLIVLLLNILDASMWFIIANGYFSLNSLLFCFLYVELVSNVIKIIGNYKLFDNGKY